MLSTAHHLSPTREIDAQHLALSLYLDAQRIKLGLRLPGKLACGSQDESLGSTVDLDIYNTPGDAQPRVIFQKVDAPGHRLGELLLNRAPQHR